MNEATRIYALNHDGEDVRRLSLQTLPDGVNRIEAMQMIEGRRIAKEKIPAFYDCKDVVYPVRLSMEQCSSELTARYKASIVSSLCMKRNSMIDLTGGFGVDFFFISELFANAVYVEQRSELKEIVEANFNALGRNNCSFVNTDSASYLSSLAERVNLIFIDPARRDVSGRKVALIEDCEPNLLDLLDRMKSLSDYILVKLSPMLDVKSAVEKVSGVKDVYAVSVCGEMKELLMLIDSRCDDKANKVVYNAVDLFDINSMHIDTFDPSTPVETDYSDPLSILYEPNASLMKLSGHSFVAAQLGLKKISPMSHLYTSDVPLPFHSRIFNVERVCSLKDDYLRTIKKANVSVRNFPLTAEELKKRLKVKDGGDIYLFGTTLKDGRHVVIVCRKHV